MDAGVRRVPVPSIVRRSTPKRLRTLLEPKRQGGESKAVVLNFITPHQKVGDPQHLYSDNLLMLTLSRGGPIVWMSETDAKVGGIEDNDWIEAFNANGALVARAVVSQRVRARHGDDVPRPGENRERAGQPR